MRPRCAAPGTGNVLPADRSAGGPTIALGLASTRYNRPYIRAQNGRQLGKKLKCRSAWAKNALKTQNAFRSRWRRARSKPKNVPERSRTPLLFGFRRAALKSQNASYERVVIGAAAACIGPRERCTCVIGARARCNSIVLHRPALKIILFEIRKRSRTDVAAEHLTPCCATLGEIRKKNRNTTRGL